MAKKAATRPRIVVSAERATVTPERFARLYLLLNLLAKAPQTREVLARKLKVDVRGFYRDLEVLRDAGIHVVLSEGRYRLADDFEASRGQLPFPDPLLSLGELQTLAQGRNAAHRRLRAIIQRRLR